jgi:methyl-accepting chemotaxis protein
MVEDSEGFMRLERKLEQHDECFDRVELKLEKIEGDLKLVLEVMHTGFASFRRDVQTHIDDLKARLSLVEEIVRQNSRDITYVLTAIQEVGRTVQRNTALMDEHTRELRDLRAAIDRIDDHLDEKAARAEVEAIEHRVAALEAEVLGRKS